MTELDANPLYDFVATAGEAASFDAVALPLAVVQALGGLWPTRIALEVQRHGDVARFVARVRLDERPKPERAWFEAQGWSFSERDPVELRGGERERIKIEDAEGFVALTYERPTSPLDPETVYEALRALPWLAPFAPLARPPAEVKRFGLGIDQEHGRIGLLAVHHDLARLADDESILRAGGFVDSDEEAVWCLEDRTRSLIWMGGVVYGYVGALPRVAGDWV